MVKLFKNLGLLAVVPALLVSVNHVVSAMESPAEVVTVQTTEAAPKDLPVIDVTNKSEGQIQQEVENKLGKKIEATYEEEMQREGKKKKHEGYKGEGKKKKKKYKGEGKYGKGKKHKGEGKGYYGKKRHRMLEEGEMLPYEKPEVEGEATIALEEGEYNPEEGGTFTEEEIID